VVLKPKKFEIIIIIILKKIYRENWIRAEKTQILCHEIEPNPSKDRAMHDGDNHSFWDEFI
jgi:hypothetical protein